VSSSPEVEELGFEPGSAHLHTMPTGPFGSTQGLGLGKELRKDFRNN
jgi:hypothetical protein